MARITNFDNANLRLLVTDQDGILEAASLQQSDGAMQFAVATITDAQIKVNHGSYTILEDPGSGIINIPTLICVHTNFVADYANVDGVSTFLVRNGNVTVMSINENDWSFYDPGGPQTYASTPSAGYDAAAETTSPLFFNSSNRAPGAMTCLINNQTSGNLTGGSSANTITITVYYIPLTL